MFNKAIYSKVLFVFFCFLLLCSCQKSFQDRKTLRTTRSEIVKINTELGITYMQNQQYDDAEEKLKKVINNTFITHNYENINLINNFHNYYSKCIVKYDLY